MTRAPAAEPFATLSRRDFLVATGSGIVAATACRADADATKGPPKQIAAIATAFRYRSHAHGIVGRWLDGFDLDGMSDRPESQLVSVFIEQTPKNDIGRAMCDKHGVSVFPTIREALCRGGEKLAVDGVLLIGEHGTYPFDEQGRHLYPRRRFFEEIVAVFRNSGRAVPVFNDKHLAYTWPDAKWMYDQAVELQIPFMAGSSLPNAWRAPPVEFELGTKVDEALAVAYGGTESYGFHALEMLQCMVERRDGGETGIAAVQTLEGDAVWKAGEDRRWSRSLLEAALKTGTQKTKPGAPEQNCKNPLVFLIEYKSGLRGAVLMLSGHTAENLFAARIAGRDEPVAVNFRLQDGFPSTHFKTLAQGIDRMFTSGKPSWPVERTLLTTGILDAALTSRFENQRRLETPHLAMTYPPGPAWQEPPLPKTGPPIATR